VSRYQRETGNCFPRDRRAGSSMIALMAVSCGLVAASSYFAQPLLSTIASDVGLPMWAASWVVTFSQLGYCAGLLFLAPLGDRIENRRLVLVTLGLLCVALFALAHVHSGPAFLVAALTVGLGSTVVQMIVPLAAHMSDASTRGSVVGKVTSGLLAGIMLARPAASLLSQQIGWRGVYLADAILLCALGLLLARYLPTYRPVAPLSYWRLISSLHQLLKMHAPLRRFGASQGFLFGAFSLFWGAAPIVLLHRFGLSETELALFALAGAGGALAAPVAGGAADRGYGTHIRFLGIALVAAGFVLTLVPRVPAWVVAALMIDAGVQICHVIAQRAVLSIEAASRNRLNSLYIAIFFLGGALGSAMVSCALAVGWTLIVGIGVLFMAGATLVARVPSPALQGELTNSI
jgi:predicted MFS family arabinose efflux permease